MVLPLHMKQASDRWMNATGIDNRDFFAYFEGKSRAFAIEIQNLQEFNNPIDPYETMPGFVPPQSYCYVDGGKCIAPR